MNNYVKQNIALKKMKVAWDQKSFVYVYGATGYGKTEMVKHFLLNKKYFYFSAKDHNKLDSIEKLLPTNNKKITTVVIDDLQFIDDIHKNVIKDLILRVDCWVVLISRSENTVWLSDTLMANSFIAISEDDLRISKADINALLLSNKIELSNEDIDFISETSQGNIYVLNYVVNALLSNNKNLLELNKIATKLFEDYMVNQIMQEWSPAIKMFLIQMSLVDEFTVELAKIITGYDKVEEFITQAQEIGNFLITENECYKIREPLYSCLNNIAYKKLKKSDIDEKLYNVGLYYENNGKDTKAMDLYAKCNKSDRIMELLIRNSKKNPGAGYYYEMRKYYLMLNENEAQKRLELMSALSMLYSLLFNVEQSEYWYECIKSKLSTAKGNDKKQIKSTLVYLDIALPHRGSNNILDIILNGYKLMMSKDITLPEFSVTSNMPSAMNGGKDFCDWSLKDKMIAKTFGKAICTLLGKFGKGLVNVALAESFYEKSYNFYEVASRLSRAKLETESSGKIELEFAIVGIQTRMYIFDGDIDSARMLILSFRDRVIRHNATKLLEHIDTLLCRLALYKGETQKIKAWMSIAPNENDSFYIMDRYRYACKIRCYISLGRLNEAYSLNEKLSYYAEEYDRKYIKMQCRLISAIIKYRKNDSWQEDFLEALSKICEYKFTKIISEEGQAINPLMLAIQKQALKCPKIDKDWFETVLLETGSMSIKYSAYLKTEIASTIKLSNNALKVLILQSKGYSNTKIAEELNLSPHNVRYHIKENYKKLGVNNKTDAIILAKSLKII